jgi:hypothetical protein
MSALYRWPIAILGACLASIGTSSGLCGWAARLSSWPRWADFICGHNAPLPWLVSVPVLAVAFNLLLLVSIDGSSQKRK